MRRQKEVDVTGVGGLQTRLEIMKALQAVVVLVTEKGSQRYKWNREQQGLRNEVADRNGIQ